MSSQGDLNFIAATVSEIKRQMQERDDARLKAFEGLLSSIESSMADLLANIEKGGGAAAIAAMAEAIGKLRMPEVNYQAPQIDLQPVFNVPPAAVPALPPITLAPESVQALALAMREVQVIVEATMPQGQAPTTVFNAPRIASWELRIAGAYGAPDRVMKITPTYLKD